MNIEERELDASPQALARLGGALYLVMIVKGVNVEKWRARLDKIAV